MILYKKVEIDLDAERHRINNCGYTNAEKAKLLKLVNFVEDNDLQGGIEFSQKWSQEMREYVGEHWNILWEASIGQQFFTAEEIAAELMTKILANLLED